LSGLINIEQKNKLGNQDLYKPLYEAQSKEGKEPLNKLIDNLVKHKLVDELDKNKLKRYLLSDKKLSKSKTLIQFRGKIEFMVHIFDQALFSKRPKEPEGENRTKEPSWDSLSNILCIEKSKRLKAGTLSTIANTIRENGINLSENQNKIVDDIIHSC